MRFNSIKLAFNRGRMSVLALARTDIEKLALSAETQTNWMPRVLGSMMLRTGLKYLLATHSNAKAVYLNFIFSLSDQADIELTNNVMRVLINDAVITRPSVTTTIANQTFDSNLTSWTDADESGGASAWVTGGYMGLTGDGTNAAVRTQQVTVAGANISVEHGVRVKINRGVVKFKIGSTAGGEEYVTEAILGKGEFSFAFTPTADFHITVSSITKYTSQVDSISIESAGILTIATSWAEANLPSVRYDQSGDILFVVCNGIKQYKIERRATRSWGIVEYLPEDGPFLTQNLSAISIYPSALSGDITLTASKAFFKSTNIGSLIKIASIGQSTLDSFSSANVWSAPIRITGVGSSRAFNFSISGVWVGTVNIQQSVAEIGSWVDYGVDKTANITSGVTDGLDNQIVYYRIGIDTGNYTSGTAVCTLSYAAGSISGVARITAYSSATSVSAITLKDFGGTSVSTAWSESGWSDRRGFPSSVGFYEGRLWFAGKDKIFASVSDSYESFDDSIEGNSTPIIRSIGSGPIDNINWLLGLQRLIIGAETSEKVVRSDSLDSIITTTNFNIKTPSTRGSTAVAAIKIDSSGVFVRNDRLFELMYDGGVFDYKTEDLTRAIPEIANGGFVKIAVQRYPDTRIHCIKSDGTAAILIFDRNEDMKCWIDIATDGTIEDVIVSPATSTAVEDSVKYSIKRNINGSDVRYFEKFALESECVGGTQNKQADSFIAATQASSATITGLSHLNGEAVVVWADGKNFSPFVSGVQTTFTVSGGSITLPSAVVSYVVGLPYKAQYKSTKLAYGAQGGTGLLQKKKIEALGVILQNTHNQGLRYGSSFTSLYSLPTVVGGKAITTDQIFADYDERTFPFAQSFDTDSRLCLEANAPIPCTILAAVMTMQMNEKV